MNVRSVGPRASLVTSALLLALGYAACSDAPADGPAPIACVSAAECPGADGECGQRTCANAVCGVEFAAAGTPCNGFVGDACDGLGTCLVATGRTCATAAECLSGFCIDATCCDTACAATCESCAVAGHGVCAAFDPGTDPEGECGGGVCDGQTSCAAGAYRWSKTWAGIAIGSIAVDSGGDLLIVGNYVGSPDLGCGAFQASSGPFDAFAAKLDPQGGCLWQRTFNGPAGERGMGIAVDPNDEVLVVGSFQGSATLLGGATPATGAQDGFVVKLDATGAPRWLRTFGGVDPLFFADEVVGVAVDADGGVFITGHYGAPFDFAGAVAYGGKIDAFVAKLDGDGTPLWLTPISSPDNERITPPAVDEAGLVYAGGTHDGYITLKGATYGAGVGPDLMWLRCDSDGVILDWGNRDDTVGVTVSTTALQGNNLQVVAGTFGGELATNAGPAAWTQGGKDSFLYWAMPLGQGVSVKGYGDATDQEPFVIATDPAHNLVVAGTLFGTVDFGSGPISSVMSDVVVAKLSAGTTAAPLWTRKYGADGAQRATAVATDADGNVFVAGRFEGGIDLGEGFVTAQSTDGFLISLGP